MNIARQLDEPGEQVVHVIRHHNPRNDGQLIQRDQRAANPRRGQFGDIQRRQHRCYPHRHSDHKARRQKQHQAVCHTRKHGKHAKKHSVHYQHRPAAVAVAKRTGKAAPIAAPASTMLTANSVSTGVKWNCCRTNRMAPEITLVSYPNRQPAQRRGKGNHQSIAALSQPKRNFVA